GEVPLSEASRLVVIDKPGAPQSLILAAQLAPPTGVENNIELELMNDVIGGAYAARINQNLRVDKHWSYGAYTFFRDARGQRPWIIYAPVQTDRTADSLRELQDELRRFLGTHPATPDEHTRVFRSNAYSLPGRFETNGAVLGALLDNQRFERPDDYVPKLKARYEAVGLENLQAAAEEVLRPDGITWVVVGDRGEIEEELRALGIAEPEFMDTDGRLLPPLEAADETD
ncbi:MAG: insulinase family protein, partial [Xanthomonadales bacterium]|nr:insulinase family protein [Xanthomonadales bacterium]